MEREAAEKVPRCSLNAFTLPEAALELGEVTLKAHIGSIEFCCAVQPPGDRTRVPPAIIGKGPARQVPLVHQEMGK